MTWEQQTLASLGVEVQAGFSSGKHADDGDVLHLRPMNITPLGTLTLDSGKFIAADVGAQRVRHGDVLFNNTNSPKWVGKTAYVNSDQDLAFSNHMTRLRTSDDRIDSKFLATYLHYQQSLGYFEEICSNHVNQASVSRQALLQTVVPLPPLSEQRRIVEALEAHLSRLDAALIGLTRVTRRSRSLAELLTDDMVLGRSESTAGSEPPPADLSGKHERFDYQALPTLPESWSWRLASNVCERIASGSTPPAALMSPATGDVPFLKVYNVAAGGYVDFTKDPTFIGLETHRGKLKRSVTLPGDVVTNIVGPPLGKSAVVPDDFPEWNHNQAIVSFRAGPDLDPAWLAACLRAPFVIDLLKATAKATAGQFNIALSTCRELPLPVPPLGTQRRLLARLEEGQQEILRARTTATSVVQRSESLRRSLLRAAFAGDLVDQYPTDEPATVALSVSTQGTP